MRSFLRLFLISLSCAATRSRAEDVARYFDDVRQVKAPPDTSYVTVTKVDSGLPADRAGVRAGDRIIGVDGLRARSIVEVTFLRHYYDRRTNMLLTVVRDGVITNLPIRGLFPVRRIGTWFNQTTPRFEEAIRPWRIEWTDIFGEAPPPPVASAGGIPEDLLDAFAAEAPPPRVLPFVRTEQFPARGVEAILGLDKKNSPADREWVVRLLQVYARLLAERYDEAGALIVEHRLLERKVHPFLDQLARFYKALADNRISADEIQVSRYGVDIPFFVMCYPYPVMPEKRTNAFAFDPRFQELFDKASSGVGAFQGDLKRGARSYMGRPGGAAEEYLGQVKASLLDSETQGGWPHRSSIMYDGPTRAEVLRKLMARLDEQPGRAVETAFAILAPAVTERNGAAFERAYRIVSQAGAREAGFANALIDNTARWWNMQGGNYLAILKEVDGSRPKPAIYDYLDTVSLPFHCRASAGTYLRAGTFVEDLGGYCGGAPDAIARALASPYDLEEMERLMNAGGLFDEAPSIEEALRVLSYEMGANPRPAPLDALLRLSPAVGVGPVFDAMAVGFGYGAMMHPGRAPRCMADKCGAFIAGIEDEHYETIASSLRTMDPKAPAFDEEIGRFHKEAGVPSVCLLISRRLREVGRGEEAQRFADKAVGFHYVLLQSCDTWPLMALRDFASVPGLEVHFDRHRYYQQQYLRKPFSVLPAVLDSYRGDTEAAVRHLVESAQPASEHTNESFLYDGRIWRSAAALRERLAGDLSAKKLLSEDQQARLKAIGAL